MSHSIDEIERLVSAEIKMGKVSERSVLVGRMKLEDAMLAPFEFNDRAAAWRQSFHETLCGGASDRSSVKFRQGNAAMIRDVQIHADLLLTCAKAAPPENATATTDAIRPLNLKLK